MVFSSSSSTSFSIFISDPGNRGTLPRPTKTEKRISNSCTDSGIGFTEYGKQRIPSTFQSYDTYRAKKANKYMAESLLASEKLQINANKGDRIDNGTSDESVTKLLTEDVTRDKAEEEFCENGIRK